MWIYLMIVRDEEEEETFAINPHPPSAWENWNGWALMWTSEGSEKKSVISVARVETVAAFTRDKFFSIVYKLHILATNGSSRKLVRNS